MKKLDEREVLQEKIIKRFFSYHGYHVKLIGDVFDPMIIWDEKFILSCAVVRDEINFFSTPQDGEVVRTFNMKRYYGYNKHDLKEAIDLGIHRRAYRIKMMDNDLFLVGYNFLDTETMEGRYPVFARHDATIYASVEKAEEVLQSLGEDTLCII